MPNPNFTDIITTTIRDRTHELADNVTKNNAFLAHLKESGNMTEVEGGRSLVQALDYTENDNFVYYSGYEEIPIAPNETFTAAEYEIKQAAVAFTFNGLEEIQNSSVEAMINLIDSRKKNAERTMANGINRGLFSDGSASKQIGGLELIVADDPTTGTVGGIDRSAAANTFWRNQRYRATTDGGAALSSTNIQKYMNELYLLTVRGMDKVNLILADKNTFNFYWNSLQNQQRFTDASSASLGFRSVDFNGAPVVFESSDAISANHMYFLNLDYLFFKTFRSRMFAPLDARMSVNQDATVIPIVWAGNMTCSNSSLQGVLNND